MFTSTWCVIAPLLLFVPSTFLTVTGLSSFYSLNPYSATIFLSINISVVLLSKSAFTVMSLCISIFSTSIFNYTSLGILNILLMSLCLFSFFTVLFRTPVYILICCASPCLGHTTTLQSHHSCFFPVPYSEHRILFLFSFDTLATISLHLHWVYFTLAAPLSFAEFSLYLHTLRYWLYQIFFNYSPETKLYPWFSCILVPLYLYPPHSTNITTFYFVLYPCSSRAVPLGSISLSPQYFCLFLYKEYTSLFSCCTFYRLTAYATFSLLLLSFSTLILRYSYL